MFSGFRRDVDENYDLLGYYALSSGNFVPMFRDNLSVPFLGFKNPKETLLSNTEFIEGRMWTLKTLSSVVSANRVVASVWEGGEGGGLPYMGPIGCSKMSGRNYHFSPLNNAEEFNSHNFTKFYIRDFYEA